MKLCLIIEDDNDHALKAKQYASAMGFSVVTTPNGREALRICQQSLPDVILVTSMLRDMEGLSFLETLHSRNMGKNFNIIMCSESPSADHVQSAKKMGAKLYLLKPLVKDQFRAAIERLGLFD